jgi:glutathione S-transferase
MPASLPILYSFRRCPYAMRARLALAASGVVCELREVVLRNKPQALLEASAKGTVPVLVTPHGDVLDQSLDIMRWALVQHDPGHWLKPEVGSPQAMQALIAECDGGFKWQLDRYKYPGRFASERAGETVAQTEETATQFHRTEGARFLAQLNAQLATASHLFGAHAAWADMAIAPFVRQFAQTDQAWFDRQPWPGLQRWLASWLASDLYGNTMEKYPPWVPGAALVRFPFSALSR